MRKVIVFLVLALNLEATELENRKMTIDSTASFYSNKFQGRRTANGDIFNQNKYTAAYNQLPLGTEVKVIRIIKEDTYSVVVKINDRTAKRYSHRIDLSRSAAKQIKLDQEGISPVQIQIL